MWKTVLLLTSLSGYCLAGPVSFKRNKPIVQQKEDAALKESLTESEVAVDKDPHELIISSTLSLPGNATSIRADITDGFSCENKIYGYYADVDNECQIFHVCLPVTYADGKENTFRWSFICPEETIFSQDSFTCMRPEDMTISCQESYQYYELNRNFGLLESEFVKENNEIASESSASNESIMEAVKQPEPAKPVVKEEEKVVVKPVGQVQSIKVQKPNRRKPGTSHATQKKPVNPYPLRKISQVQSETAQTHKNQVEEDTIESVKPVRVEEEEEEVKQTTKQNFRRPMPAISNMFKDKIQNSKKESVINVRTELFNQKRKRPTLFTEKPVKSHEEEKENKNQLKIEVPLQQQYFSSLVSDVPNTNTETETAGNKIQASENDNALVNLGNVKGNEAPPSANNADIEQENKKVLEASEEIPAFIAEVEKVHSTVEEKPQNEEILLITNVDETQNAEGSKTDQKIQNSGKTQTDLEVQTAEETQTSEEIRTSEEAEIVDKSKTAEGTKTAEEIQTGKEHQSLEEPQISEENHKNIEAQNVKEQSEAEEIEKSEETQNTVEVQPAEEVQYLEEIQKTDKEAHVGEEFQKVQEIPIFEETPKSQVAEDVQENDTVKQTELVEQDIPADQTLAVEESQPIDVVSLADDTKFQEPQTVEDAKPVETIESIEVTVKPEQLAASGESYLSNSQITNEPSIYEKESEEAFTQTIEEMESEKPADAPESMQATEEMSHPDPIVQQMYEDLGDNKQSIGGFKPVDPVMAHEAEQLIVDFINTLRNNQFTNETPGGMHMEHYIDEIPEPETSHENVAEEENLENMQSNILNKEEITESEKTEDNNKQTYTVEEADVNQSAGEENNADQIGNDEVVEELKEQTDLSADKNNDINEQDVLKSLEDQNIENMEDSQKSDEVQTGSTNTMLNNFPQDIYQIPVKVITEPLDKQTQSEMETKLEGQPIFATVNSEEKEQEETPAVEVEAYKPLSIDDIVELVKERLDQMPKNEMETPMQLDQVLDAKETEKSKFTSEKLDESKQVQPEEQQITKAEEQQADNSGEEIIKPIFQRISQPLKVDAEVQTDDLDQAPLNEQSEVSNATLDDAKEKLKRSYKSRSMVTPVLDSRKRRFLSKPNLS